MDKPYAISSVIIKKSMTPDEAMDHALNITKKKKLKMTQTKNTYRFRNIPKTKFSDFRSKKINKDITLVFGELKPEFARLEGKGVLDYFKKGYDYIKEKAGDVVDKVKQVFTPRMDSYNNATTRMLKQYGDGIITKMVLYKKPLSDYLPIVLNAVSLGKWNQLQKKYGIDKFFHLSLICTVKGEQLNIEKNEVISITKGVPTGEGVESQEVPLQGKSFTLNQMMEKARADAGDKTYFTYSALGGNNCQNFLSYLLRGQGLYDDNASAFIFQDVEDMVAELPDYVKKFAQGTTDLASTFNKLTGQGEKKGGRYTPPGMPLPYSSSEGMYQIGFGNNDMEKFMAFLQTKGLKKKPGDAMLKKLYREFKGIKRLQGKGFWDDFKRGFNMVFEPGAKYILKPLMAMSGTPMGLAGVAGLSALGYGKSGGNLKQDTTMFALAEDLYKKIPKDQVKSGLERFASAGLNHFFPKSNLKGAGFFDDIKNFFVKTIPAVGESYARQMTDATGQIKRAVGLGKKDVMYVKEGLRKLGGAVPNDMPEEREKELDTLIGSGMSGSGLWDAIKEFVNRHAFNLLRKVNPIFGMLPEAKYRGGQLYPSPRHPPKEMQKIGGAKPIIAKFHKWLVLNADKHPNDTLRALFKKYSNSK
jgi:hypothetical protein